MSGVPFNKIKKFNEEYRWEASIYTCLPSIFLIKFFYLIKWYTRHYHTALSIINSEDTDILQKGLDEISKWACKRQLKFNVSKVWHSLQIVT